jgi:membrane protease subunit HflC
MEKRVGLISLLSIAVAGIVLASSVYTVDQREMALVLQFGEPVSSVREAGLNLKLPFIQNVLYFDNRIQNFISDTKEVIAKDQKQMRVDAFCKYKIVDPLRFFQTAKTELRFKNRLDGIVDSSLRQVLGGVPFDALLSEKRRELMHKIRDVVGEQTKGFGVEVVDVRIMRADLPDVSRNAVYNRMRADREKEAREIRAKGAEEANIIRATADKERQLLLAEAEKKAQLLKGEGDAEATKIFANAFGKDVEFFEFYRSLESYKKAINKETDTILLSPNSEFMKHFNPSEKR